MTYQ
jgi:hypothetical protein